MQIKTGIDRASKGAVCTGMELVALATLLQFVLTLRRGIATAIQDNGERLDILLPIARLVRFFFRHAITSARSLRHHMFKNSCVDDFLPHEQPERTEKLSLGHDDLIQLQTEARIIECDI